MKVFLARHGQTQYNLEDRYQGQYDSLLTEVGINQAQLLAKFLTEQNINQIYHSPLSRAKHTTQIIAKKLSAKSIELKNLIEISFGSYESKLIKDRDKIDPEFIAKRYKSKYHKVLIPYPDGGESYFDLFKRVWSASQEMELQPNTVIVAHGVVNRVLRGIFLNIPFQDITSFKQTNSEIIVIDLNNNSEELIKL